MHTNSQENFCQENGETRKHKQSDSGAATRKDAKENEREKNLTSSDDKQKRNGYQALKYAPPPHIGEAAARGRRGGAEQGDTEIQTRRPNTQHPDTDD